jgi:hypothetical protein
MNKPGKLISEFDSKNQFGRIQFIVQCSSSACIAKWGGKKWKCGFFALAEKKNGRNRALYMVA